MGPTKKDTSIYNLPVSCCNKPGSGFGKRGLRSD